MATNSPASKSTDETQQISIDDVNARVVIEQVWTAAEEPKAEPVSFLISKAGVPPDDLWSHVKISKAIQLACICREISATNILPDGKLLRDYTTKRGIPPGAQAVVMAIVRQAKIAHQATPALPWPIRTEDKAKDDTNKANKEGEGEEKDAGNTLISLAQLENAIVLRERDAHEKILIRQLESAKLGHSREIKLIWGIALVLATSVATLVGWTMSQRGTATLNSERVEWDARMTSLRAEAEKARNEERAKYEQALATERERAAADSAKAIRLIAEAIAKAKETATSTDNKEPEQKP
jgi:hypothetical protein